MDKQRTNLRRYNTVTILQEDQTGDYLIARSEYVPGLLVELAAALEGRLPKKDSFPYLIVCTKRKYTRITRTVCCSLAC